MRSAIAVIGWCAAALTAAGCAETSHEMKSAPGCGPGRRCEGHADTGAGIYDSRDSSA